VRPKGGSGDRAVTVQVHCDQVGRGVQTGWVKTVVLADVSAENVRAEARARLVANGSGGPTGPRADVSPGGGCGVAT
jgi:hypothetical protein